MPIHPNSLKNLEKGGGFDVHPENINRKGRPPKLTKDVLNTLQENGVDRVDSTQIRQTIETLLNCTKRELETYSKAKGQPFAVNVLAQHLLNAKDDTTFFNSLLDRAQGKATERKEITHTTAPQSLSELYEAEEAEVVDED